MKNHPTEIPKHPFRFSTSFPEWHMADVKNAKLTEQTTSSKPFSCGFYFYFAIQSRLAQATIRYLCGLVSGLGDLK